MWPTGKNRRSEGAGSRGFTLVEVLVALGILTTGLTLVAAAFSRHLAALAALRGSLTAHRLAEEELVREYVRRCCGAEIPAQPLEAFTVRLDLRSVVLQPEPVKDLQMEQATSEVSWNLRQQQRTLKMTAGFSPSKEPTP